MPPAWPTGKTGGMSTELDLTWLDPSLGALQRRERGFGTGLCRAIADRLGIDVTLVRVAFVILGLSAGLGLGLYLWGTALTAGPDGRRPAETMFPGFLAWSPIGQKAFVLGSLIAVMALTSWITPLPWFAGVGLLIALVLWRNNRAPGGAATGATTTALELADNDDELVAAWRSTIASAVGPARPSPLPEIDLYSPEPEPAPSPAPRPRSGWGIGLAILVLPSVAAAIAYAVFGLGPLHGLGTFTATAAVLTLGYSLMVRRRRVPRTVLALVALTTAGTGWLAVQAAAVPEPTPYPEVMNIRVVGERTEIDLTAEDLEGIEEIRIQAIASELEVNLPAPVTNVAVSEPNLGTVTYGSRSGAAPLDIEVTVDARLSYVELDGD